jgi:DNA-binding PadR family transcriptional regulator
MSDRVGVFELLVLMAVSSCGREAHGVPIRQAVEVSRGREVSSGAVHTTLERLERRGFVVSRVGDVTPARGGRPRRYYALTRAGEVAVRSNYAAVRRLAGLISPRLTR